ncbi:MAG: hypothetical protein VYD57_13955 [Pseudomonadota bacterium]|nr:hypothetical protein [Pseudomonadota bacterium]
MNKLLLAATIAAFGATPVMAQSSDTTSNAASDTTSSASSNSTSMSTEDMVASQKKVLSALQQAGYQDATIMDAAYMVQARTPDGETVLMMIDTSGRVMGAQRAPQDGSQSGSAASSSNSSNSSSNGESK